jgi:hypothetical protein
MSTQETQMPRRPLAPPAPEDSPSRKEDERHALRIESETAFRRFAESVKRSSQHELEQALRSR